MTSRGAVLPAEKNNRQMEPIPIAVRKKPLEIPLGAFHRLSFRKAPTRREAVNMGIDRKRRDTERLGHDDARRLMPHPGKRLKGRDVRGHFSLVLIHQDLGKRRDISGFARGKTTSSDERKNLGLRKPSHRWRVGCGPKERRRHLVDPLVCTLSGQKYSNQQSKRILVVQGNRRVGIERMKDPADLKGLFGSRHNGQKIAKPAPPQAA